MLRPKAFASCETVSCPVQYLSTWGVVGSHAALASLVRALWSQYRGGVVVARGVWQVEFVVCGRRFHVFGRSQGVHIGEACAPCCLKCGCNLYIWLLL